MNKVSTPAILLLRHGETVWNTQNRKQGHCDSPLTERGRLQVIGNARKLGRHISLSDRPTVFSSPLGRARQTALILVEELGLEPEIITYDSRLQECCFGVWEGLTKTEIKLRFHAEWKKRLSDRWNTPAPGGESYADVHKRVSAWYADRSPQNSTIVVSHGLTSRVLRGLYLGLPHQEVFDLSEPQDGFFRLQDGAESFVE